MKILHTSDWHLDHRLFEHRRLEEHAGFFEWLRELIVKEQVNALIISGDIFDNRGPTHEIQDLYFKFLPSLYRDFLMGKSVCRNIVIIAGNHDSVSFLERTKPLMEYLKISIVGSLPDQVEDWSDLILELKNEDNTEALVLALPFLTEADMNNRAAGKTIQEKRENSISAFLKDWQNAANLCVTKRDKIIEQAKNNFGDSKPPYIPIISTGHLFTQGGKTADQDDGGNKDKYSACNTVGNLEKIPGEQIPKEFDYVALGHLHIPQLVCEKEHIRYCGSPIPISFSEAAQQKFVVLADWDENGNRTITPIEIPVFQKIVMIRGDWNTVTERIKELKILKESIWLEIQYTDKERRLSIAKDIQVLLENSRLELLRLIFSDSVQVGIKPVYKGEKLETLNPRDVFQRVLDENGINGQESEELKRTYEEALQLCGL